MARTAAINQLQDQVEAIRKEAFAAGYAAAMQAVRDLAAKSAPSAASAAAPPQRRRRATRRGRPARAARAARPAQAAAAPAARPTRQRARRGAARATPRAARGAGRAAGRAAGRPAGRGAGRAAGARPQRGTNARFVEEVLQANAPRALRPAEIRTAIQRDKGVSMAFTSIRHALGQLEARNAAEQIADSKTWRYRGSGGASTSG